MSQHHFDGWVHALEKYMENSDFEAWSFKALKQSYSNLPRETLERKLLKMVATDKLCVGRRVFREKSPRFQRLDNTDRELRRCGEKYFYNTYRLNQG